MANRSERGANFHIVTPPRAEDIMGQVASCLDVRREEVPPTAIFQAYAYLSTYDPHHSPRPHELDPIFNGRVSKVQQVAQRAEVLLNKPVSSLSYGIAMPTYLKVLHERKESTQEADHSALLLGALTEDTVREFSTTVRTVFPGAACDVIDLAPDALKKVAPEVATFHQGNVLGMPFAEGTYQSVQGHYIMDYMKQPQYNPVLFCEANRVLSDDGTLALIEPVSVIDTMLLDQLQYAGFAHSTLWPVETFVNRTEMDNFLRSTSARPLPNTTELKPRDVLILAQKKAAV